MIDDKYYIYRHIRLDKDQVFYVGIGTKRVNCKALTCEYYRAFTYDSRSSFWWNIVNKTDFRVDLLFETSDIDLIISKEIEFIKLYGRKDLGSGTLVNLTNGGDGIKGYNHTHETKLKMVLQKKKFIESKKDAFLELYNSGVSRLDICEKLNISPWTASKIRKLYINNKRENSRKKKYYCYSILGDLLFYSTLSDLSKFTGMSESGIRGNLSSGGKARKYYFYRETQTKDSITQRNKTCK